MALFPPNPHFLKLVGDLELSTPDKVPVKLKTLWTTQSCLLRHVRSFGSLGCRAGLQELLSQRPRLQQYKLNVAVVLPEEPQRVAAYQRELRLPFVVLADPEKLSFLALGAKQINWATPENIRGLSQTSVSTALRLNNSLRFMPTTHLIEPSGVVSFCWLNTSLKDDPALNQIFDTLDDL